MNFFSLALLLCGALTPDTPKQSIVGAEKPIPLGELVDLHVPSLSPPPANFHSASYAWKVVDLSTGDSKTVRHYTEGGKDGVFFGSGIKAKKLKVFCSASYLFAEKDAGGNVKEVVVKTALLEADVVVGEPAPPTPPIPPPDPPTPTPTGPLRVLIVYETSERGKLTPAQDAILSSVTFRSYLDSVCADDPQTGSKKAWWMLDKDVDVSALAKVWQDAMKRPRPSTPYIHILKGDVVAYEGLLPASVDEAKALVGKYAKTGGK